MLPLGGANIVQSANLRSEQSYPFLWGNIVHFLTLKKYQAIHKINGTKQVVCTKGHLVKNHYHLFKKLIWPLDTLNIIPKVIQSYPGWR